jgi:hypothetical protein
VDPGRIQLQHEVGFKGQFMVTIEREFSLRTDVYWLYDPPTWLSGILALGAFVVIGFLGLFPTRKLVRSLESVGPAHNDIVGFYLAGVIVLYGCIDAPN